MNFHRNLNSLCSSKRCRLSITDEKRDKKANKISAVIKLQVSRHHRLQPQLSYIYVMSISLPLFILQSRWAGEPWMYGDLKICRGPKNIFREFPTTQVHKTKWNCIKLTKSKVKPVVGGIYAVIIYSGK